MSIGILYAAASCGLVPSLAMLRHHYIVTEHLSLKCFNLFISATQCVLEIFDLFLMALDDMQQRNVITTSFFGFWSF
jgi:hypothetical protein